MKRKGYPFGNERRLHKRKRIIVIAAEGEVTEPQYFSHLNSMSQSTVIVMVPNLGNGSDPKAVLKRMEKYLRDNPLEGNDEAWIVLDQDDWPEDKLKQVEEWTNKSNRHFALSIRRFEDWLRLHIERDPVAQKQYQDNISGKNKHIPGKVFQISRRTCRIRRSVEWQQKKISKNRKDDLTLLKTSLYYS